MSSNTGYYYTPDNALRHAHPDDHQGGQPYWHEATTVHLDPTLHQVYNSFDPVQARWAKANANIPADAKSTLIINARKSHDESDF